MKSLMLLLDSILQDCSIHCGTTTTRVDYRKIAKRVEHEGLSFLTITLGTYADDFERSLEAGFICPGSFRSFEKNGAIPKLFSGMLQQVFDINGKLLPSPSIAAISCIRQVCRMFKKIHLPCSKEREDAAFAGYGELERELRVKEPGVLENPFYKDFKKLSRLLWGTVLAKVDSDISFGEHIPRHGPGAVAERILPNQKYTWRTWHQRLDVYFPPDLFLYGSSEAFLDESCPDVDMLPEELECPVRVIQVPKTLKTPRIIGIEPACMQYAQQSLLPLIVRQLETHPLTRGHVNFSDQSVNAKLALRASKDCTLATLDLSEASDRVLNSVVTDMLSVCTNVIGAIMACRSNRATTPDGITHHLKKFASMGSALCFPVESMVFYTLLLLSVARCRGIPITSSSLVLLAKDVYVYGDDLIVPVDVVPAVMETLNAFALKVNDRKSFWTGKFRESCGVDAYDGVDVTPVYVRRMFPRSGQDASALVSAVSLSNQLYSKGYYRATRTIERLLKRFRAIPIVSETASCVGYVRPGRPLTVHRYNRDLHRAEVFGLVPVIKKRDDRIDGRSALMKWFLQGLNPDVNHWRHSVGSGPLAVKNRWSSINR